MKPSEARNLQPGTVLAGPKWGGRRQRIVVQSVNVAGPRTVFIVDECKSSGEWRAADVGFPTGQDEAAWKREDEKKAAAALLNEQLKRVQDGLGVAPVNHQVGFCAEPRYMVTLELADALAICDRLDPDGAIK